MRRVLVADDCPTCNASGQGSWNIFTPQGEKKVCPDCLGTGNQETWISWDTFVAMVKYGEEPAVVIPDEQRLLPTYPLPGQAPAIVATHAPLPHGKSKW